MSATFERIWEELVPREGNATTVAGEMVRAAGRLRYDFYNNGMGNNTSGALKFLREKGAIDKELFEYVLPYTTGRIYQGNYDGDFFHVAIDRIVEMTTKMVTFNPQLMTMENTEDMLDYSDEDDSDLDPECPECEGSGVVTFDWGSEDEYDDDCDVCGGRGYIIQ